MPSLTATYTSSSSSQTFSQPLPAISNPPSASDRVAYLAELQSSTKQLQGALNTFLTQKMEEDKATGAGGAKVDDAEEQNYGEEIADED